jgi:hypothetical protein
MYTEALKQIREEGWGRTKPAGAVSSGQRPTGPAPGGGRRRLRPEERRRFYEQRGFMVASGSGALAEPFPTDGTPANGEAES